MQRACIFLLVLFMLLVPLSALGESKSVQPAEETSAGGESQTLLSVSPTDTPSASAVFYDTSDSVMGAIRNVDENLSDQIDVPVLNDACVAAQNALIETRTAKDRAWLNLKKEEQAKAEAARLAAEEAARQERERAAAAKKAASTKSGKQTKSTAVGNHSTSAKSSPKVSGKNGRSLGVFKLTAYCPCYECSKGWGRMTSSGRLAQENHTIATDPSVIPEGTRVVINGTVYVAEDTGGGVVGKHIDIFMESHSATLSFGVQHAEVFLAD
nr:3D domain-containing protein [uncultured Stomatobaculum sp.]